MELRPYQTELIEKIRQSMMAGNRRVLLQCSTGAGKTVIGAEMVKNAYLKGKRVYWLSHRSELIDQASEAFTEARVPHGIMRAGGEDDGKAVQICSVQTLVRRLERMAVPGLVVSDEAHRAKGRMWERILTTYKNAFQVGLTATALRLDGKGLGTLFDDMVIGPPMRWLIDQGYLSEYRYFGRKMDMGGVGTVAGDFKGREAETAVKKAKITGSLISEYQEHTPGQQMLVFLPTLKMSREMTDELNDAGIVAMHIDGETPEKARRFGLSEFRAKRIKVICSVDLFLEGLDCPGVEVVGMLRPTMSTTVFLQAIGRGMRPAEGKKFCTVFDHVGNFMRHGMPDDPREWKLEMDKDKRTQAVVPSVQTCGDCFAVWQGNGRQKCPYCGSVQTKKERIYRTEAGRLAEIKKEERAAVELAKKEMRRGRRKIESYEDAVAFGKWQGYKASWARHYCKAKGIYVP